MLRRRCWDADAETQMPRRRCRDADAETQMLRRRCWDADAETQMLRRRCWDAIAETQMLRGRFLDPTLLKTCKYTDEILQQASPLPKKCWRSLWMVLWPICTPDCPFDYRLERVLIAIPQTLANKHCAESWCFDKPGFYANSINHDLNIFPYKEILGKYRRDSKKNVCEIQARNRGNEKWVI